MCQLSRTEDWGRSKGAGEAGEQRSCSKFFPLCPSASLPLFDAQPPMPNLTPFHRTPLELGIKPARRGSISTAWRVALAKALNVASMM